jgi:RNA polymerase sigma-70 factor (ECF subfamily)
MRSISDNQFRAWGQRLRHGDRLAYADLFHGTYDALLRYVTYITHDQQAAHDILQEVYLKLWNIRATIDPDRSLRALLFQMARNYALNHERQKKRHATDALEDSVFEPQVGAQLSEDLDAQALHQWIQTWIERMPARRREAFLLSRYEGLSHEEIARLMQLAPKTVNNHIVLALQYLRDRLQAFEVSSL